MLWHVEISIHAALVLGLIFLWRSGLRYWEAWVVARFVFDLGQFLLERFGHPTAAANVWYVGILATCALLPLVLREAQPGPHRNVLFVWIAANMACAWIRFFPWTGRATIAVDAISYGAWAWLLMRRRIT